MRKVETLGVSSWVGPNAVVGTAQLQCEQMYLYM